MPIQTLICALPPPPPLRAAPIPLSSGPPYPLSPASSLARLPPGAFPSSPVRPRPARHPRTPKHTPRAHTPEDAQVQSTHSQPLPDCRECPWLARGLSVAGVRFQPSLPVLVFLLLPPPARTLSGPCSAPLGPHVITPGTLLLQPSAPSLPERLALLTPSALFLQCLRVLGEFQKCVDGHLRELSYACS